MSILINTHNEREEKLLVNFLNNNQFDYKSDVISIEEAIEAFLDDYNKEIEQADAEIESGDYVDHDEVEKLFADRRKKLNDH